MKKLKWKRRKNGIYNIWESGDMIITRMRGINIYNIRIQNIGIGFKKLKDAKKVSQLIHNG